MRFIREEQFEISGVCPDALVFRQTFSFSSKTNFKLDRIMKMQRTHLSVRQLAVRVTEYSLSEREIPICSADSSE